MSANPYSAAAMWHRGYKAEIERKAFQRTLRKPALGAVHAAYVAGEIDHIDLEQLIQAALTSTPVEIPKAMQHRLEPSNTSSLQILKASRKYGFSPTQLQAILRVEAGE